MLSSEYFWYDDIMLRLFVGYCYDLDYSLIVDIGVSVITNIFLGINPVIKLVRCHRIGLFKCNHICLYGKALMRSIDVPIADASNVGKVMGMRYPDQVGGHEPCEPELFCALCPRLGPFMPRRWP